MLRQALLACVLGLGALACSGGDDATATPTGTATGTATPAPTSEPTVAPTEVPPSASATPTATATVAPTPVSSAGQRFGVVKVRSNDPDGGLNLRAEPAAGAAVLAVIPFDATELIATGESSGAGDEAWYEVAYEGTTGWVSANFLSPLPSMDEVACDPDGSEFTFGGDLPAIEAEPDPEADHLLALHQYEDGGCQRTVLTFGRDFDFDRDLEGTLQPAEGLPAGLAAALDLASLRVELPEAVTAAATTATQSLRLEDGLADVFFVRPTSGPRFDVVALWERNRGARVTALRNPGRLVIDTTDAPTGSGLDLAPVKGGAPFGLTVLTSPINVDVNGPPPGPPIVVSGFSRPFEASGVVVLRTAPLEGAPAGSGDPVTADWSGGVLGESCDSLYGFMTTDYIEAWGAFEFAIEALAPGTYELFVGEFSARDGSEVGVYHVFTVGGSSTASC